MELLQNLKHSSPTKTKNTMEKTLSFCNVFFYIRTTVPGTNMAAVKFKNVPEGKCMEPSFVPLAQRWNNLAAVRNTDW